MFGYFQHTQRRTDWDRGAEAGPYQYPKYDEKESESLSKENEKFDLRYALASPLVDELSPNLI